MSFFGFDTALPDNGQLHGGGDGRKLSSTPLDFDDTYRGLGDYEQEEDDYLNEETFGGAADTNFQSDFDFGYGADAPATTTNDSNIVQSNVSYAAAASHAIHHPQGTQVDQNIDLKPMESLWGTPSSTPSAPSLTPAPQQQQVQGYPTNDANQQHVFSLEELERQQRKIQQMNMPPQFMNFPPPPQGMIGNMNFMQQQQPSNGRFMNHQFQQGMPPPQFHQQMQMPMQMNGPGMMPGQQHPMSMPPDLKQNQTPIPQQHHMQIAHPEQQQHQQQMDQQHPIHSNDIHGSPIRGSTSPMEQHQQPHPMLQQSQNFNKNMQPMVSPIQDSSNDSLRNSFSRGPGGPKREPLTPEEQKRLQTRHAKVEKILKHSGLMTPRDKDFITRYQLSQIVTEDPYNEDFYFQVYKIIQRGGVVGESNKDLIARAYLEHSGHRLGGRYKRADVALQRMQNQVEKAVTVAKERPQKNKDHANTAREGVLGRISSSLNSKAPRRQLQIPSHIVNEDVAITDDSEKSSNASIPDLEEVTRSLDNVGISQNSRTRRRSSYAFTSIDHSSVLSRSGGRNFVLNLIETIYEEVLELEAQLRSGKTTNNTALWDALHIDDESYEVCPFISMLSFDKGIKIIPRIFNFLDKSQKLKLLQTFFSELSHLNIIIISSYKTNPEPTSNQLKKIDLFQSVFLKIIVSFLSSNATFIEIMGLLMHLIRNNNVSFISTSKIGLNLITVLISRAALIKQDISRSNSLSSPAISTWNEVYDKLFTNLETKLSLVFPPKEYVKHVIEINDQTNSDPSTNNFYDQAYIWQFLASLALSGKLNHQRIIIDEIRNEIFGTINLAEEFGKLEQQDPTKPGYRKQKLYQDLNLLLNVMGLVSRDGEITELK